MTTSGHAMERAAVYKFSARVWQHSSPSGWYFVSIPIEIAHEIRENAQSQETGWGRLPATVKIGNSEWKTAIWFDTKHRTYLLPLKSKIRKKENIELHQDISVAVWI